MLKIPEIPLKTKPATKEARKAVGFSRAEKDVGTRHKIGGDPTWLQTPDLPRCESCGVKMTFYGQLDSVGDEFVIADRGIVYVFVCFDCFTTRSVIQSA